MTEQLPTPEEQEQEKYKFYITLRTVGKGAKRHEFEGFLEMPEYPREDTSLPIYEQRKGWEWQCEMIEQLGLDEFLDTIGIEDKVNLGQGGLLRLRCRLKNFDSIVEKLKEKLGERSEKELLQEKIKDLEGELTYLRRKLEEIEEKDEPR